MGEAKAPPIIVDMTEDSDDDEMGQKPLPFDLKLLHLVDPNMAGEDAGTVPVEQQPRGIILPTIEPDEDENGSRCECRRCTRTPHHPPFSPQKPAETTFLRRRTTNRTGTFEAPAAEQAAFLPEEELCEQSKPRIHALRFERQRASGHQRGRPKWAVAVNPLHADAWCFRIGRVGGFGSRQIVGSRRGSAANNGSRKCSPRRTGDRTEREGGECLRKGGILAELRQQHH